MADSIVTYASTTALTSATETTITTVTASKTLLVKGAILANNYTSSATHILKFNDIVVVPTKSIDAKDALNISWQDNGVPLTAGATIKITPSVTSSQSYYIWGVLIDV